MATIRYRRNINCLTVNQLHDLRETLATLYDLAPEHEHSFAKIAGLHGSPSPSYCRHGSPGFLTWHRAYIDIFEKALRCVNANVTLPFWDWSSGHTTGVPAPCAEPTYVNRAGNTVPNPLYAGPLPASGGGGYTSRRADIDTTSFDDLADTAQLVMGNTTFGSFQSALNSVHGSVHVRVGGDMMSVPFAGFDPIFFLHHANIDRVWAQWQASHPGALPAGESSLEMEPFNNPYSVQWRTGAEYATTDQLGYRYVNFCFILPPFIVGHWTKLEMAPDWVRRHLKTAKLQFKSDMMPSRSMEIRTLINEPSASLPNRTMCSGRFAGSFGLFGMGNGAARSLEMRAKNQRFDLELDITKELKQASADAEELSIALVPVDANGKTIPAEEVGTHEIELIVE